MPKMDEQGLLNSYLEEWMTADKLREWADAYDNGDVDTPAGVNPAAAPVLVEAIERLIHVIVEGTYSRSELHYETNLARTLIKQVTGGDL